MTLHRNNYRFYFIESCNYFKKKPTHSPAIMYIIYNYCLHDIGKRKKPKKID